MNIDEQQKKTFVDLGNTIDYTKPGVYGGVVLSYSDDFLGKLDKFLGNPPTVIGIICAE